MRKMNTYHREILTASLEARQKEFTEYQVNIDNFRLAIEAIGDDGELQPFKSQLQELLASSLLEQKKAKIMLGVIEAQLKEDN